MTVTINEVEMLGLPGEDDECPFCHHVHHGEWEATVGRDDADVKWCDVPVCGDGCCNCPCYYSRDGHPALPDDLRQLAEDSARAHEAVYRYLAGR